eukprot:Pgem_evm1s6840
MYQFYNFNSVCITTLACLIFIRFFNRLKIFSVDLAKDRRCCWAFVNFILQAMLVIIGVPGWLSYNCYITEPIATPAMLTTKHPNYDVTCFLISVIEGINLFEDDFTFSLMIHHTCTMIGFMAISIIGSVYAPYFAGVMFVSTVLQDVRALVKNADRYFTSPKWANNIFVWVVDANYPKSNVEILAAIGGSLCLLKEEGKIISELLKDDNDDDDDGEKDKSRGDEIVDSHDFRDDNIENINGTNTVNVLSGDNDDDGEKENIRGKTDVIDSDDIEDNNIENVMKNLIVIKG